MENAFSKHTYETLSQATADLQKRGYTFDFNLKGDSLLDTEHDKNYGPDTFKVVEVYRFEGMTNPGDASVVYAIETHDGIKGVLIDAYGVYADSLSREMVDKLSYAGR